MKGIEEFLLFVFLAYAFVWICNGIVWLYRKYEDNQYKKAMAIEDLEREEQRKLDEKRKQKWLKDNPEKTEEDWIDKENKEHWKKMIKKDFPD